MINFTYLNRKALCFLSFFLVLTLSSTSQQVPKGLTASSNGQYIGFYEYTPVDYSSNSSEKYPVIIFLHGIGERGNGTTELPFVLGQGIPKYINNGHPMRFFWNGKWETFLVLSPQLSRDYGDWQNFYVDEMLNYAKQNLRIDTNRIFLTGLSLGGGGVWKYASASLGNAMKFAAIAPVCGTCAMSNACNLANANLPVWAFHAQDDGIVGAGCTTSSIQAINNCNPVAKPLMTIYSNGGHFIWDRSYDTVYNWQNPNIYEWFLGQNKSLPVNTAPVANAGSDITISLPATTATINANGSIDLDGNIVRYLWRKISGPGPDIIQAPNNVSSNISGLSIPGVYVYELMVVDNRAASRFDTVQVTVNNGPPGTNLAPVAVAGTDQSITVDFTNLDSWGSSDTDGSIVSYLWTKISGPLSYNMPYNMYGSCGINGLVSGVYQFELKVTDNMGAVGKDTVQVTVNLPGLPPGNQIPNANAGPDITLTLPANNTTLNGSTSNDPDGSIQSYSWSKINGPAQYNIGNATASATPVSNLVQGSYSFRLVVTDNNGATDDDTVILTVNAAPPPVNLAPIARAGANISLTLPANSTTLNGFDSYDPDGSIVSFAWSNISGPAQFTITDPNGGSTQLSNLVQGNYSFRLLVTDNNGATSSDTVLVIVSNAPPPPNVSPLAIAGADISITLPNNTTTLNGFASTDPDGFIVSYNWVKLSGPAQFSIVNANAASTSLANLVQGSYGFRLVVTDNNGAIDSDTITVTVNAAPPPPNQVPVANAGADISITLPNNSSTLNGSASSDPDGNIVSYSWSKISGPAQYAIANASASTTALINLVQGSYHFRLVITDNNGAVDSDTIIVIVNAAPISPNQPPNANAGTDFSVSLPSPTIYLNGSASNDPDGTISTYSWAKISGPGAITIVNSTTSLPNIDGVQAGEYVFELTVTDDKGATAKDQVKLTVIAAVNVMPIANAGRDSSIALPASSAILNGSLSFDPDGIITTYNWKQVSGSTYATFTDKTNAYTRISNLGPGEYIFELTVTDNLGASRKDSVSIAVINNFRYNERLAVYPNPASSLITVQCISDSVGQSKISVYDQNGILIQTSVFVKGQAVYENQVNISRLKSGIYFLEIMINSKKKMITRFIKN